MLYICIWSTIQVYNLYITCIYKYITCLKERILIMNTSIHVSLFKSPENLDYERQMI